MTQITLQRTAGLAVALGFASLSPQVQADDNHLKIAAPEDQPQEKWRYALKSWV